MLLAGDAMPSRRLTPFDEPDYLALVELLRGADVAFANLETTVRNRDEGAPGWTQGTPMTTPPALLDDLKWMGLGLLSNANNHATDYGTGGLLATLKHLRTAGLPCAGAGANLAEARMPAYADTRGGRVGLVATTSFFRPWNRASDQRPDSPGRPGINPLAFATSYTVDAEVFDALKRGSDQLGLTQERTRHRAAFFSAKEAPSDQDDRLSFLGGLFRRGNGFHVGTRVNREDADANLRQIKEARRQADFVIFSFHSHELISSSRTTRSRCFRRRPISASACRLMRRRPTSSMRAPMATAAAFRPRPNSGRGLRLNASSASASSWRCVSIRSTSGTVARARSGGVRCSPAAMSRSA